MHINRYVRKWGLVNGISGYLTLLIFGFNIFHVMHDAGYGIQSVSNAHIRLNNN